MFRSRLPATRQGIVAAAFLATTLVFGGGGSPTAMAEMIVQLGFAAAVLAWTFWARGPLATGETPRLLVVMAVLPLALALLHLVPLPPSLWQSLPGRGIEARSLGLVGEADSWQPLSIAPSLTLASLLALVPPAGLMLATALLGLRDRRALLLIVGLAGLAGAALGAAQLAGPGDALQMYELSHRGWLTGFFANRNAAADGFLIASLALGAWSATRPTHHPRQRSSIIALLAAQAVLLVAVLMTGSRAGIALVPIAIAANALMIREGGAAALAKRLGGIAIALAAIVALVPLAVIAVPRLGGVVSRFAFSGDFRTELWTDTLFAARQYFPVGSGLGTFVSAFLPVERLEVVDVTYPNRAHNDYLEFFLEAGLPGLAVLVAMVAMGVLLIVRSWREHWVPRPFVIFAAGSFLVTALHSVVDYPLRTMALAGLFALSAGICAPRRNAASGARDLEPRE